MRLAADELVAPAHQLDELARVDVRVAAVLDVLKQLGRDLREGVGGGGRGVQVLEGVGEGFSGQVGLAESKGRKQGGLNYISLVSTSLLGRLVES